MITISEAESLTIEGEPQFIDISSNSLEIEHADINNDVVKKSIKAIIDSLIQKNNEVHWFATSLHESSILRRLEHKWRTNSIVPSSGWFTAKWIPFSLEVTSTSFILSWNIVAFDETAPRISSRFLSLSEPPSPRSASPKSSRESVRQFTFEPGQTAYMEQVFDIPLSTNTAEIDLEEEKRERQSIREARLRVELAQMKLEKHLQNYYHKYGNVPDDTDSELSESSLEED